MTPTNRPPQATLLGHYAGFISRLIAFVIDVIVISAILFSVGWFLNTSIDMLQLRSIIERAIAASVELKKIAAFIFSPTFYSILTLAIIVTYYVFFWTVAGQTIGKAVMGVKIVPRHGKKLKLHQAVLRYLGYYLSAIPFGLGFLWILVDDRRLGWHDKLAGTCVIYVWDARPDELFLTGAMRNLAARRDALKVYLTSRKKKS